MGNSSITLQRIVEDALTSAENAPALASDVGGYSDTAACNIGNDVMQAMVAGGPNGEPMAWKWNQLKVTPFRTNGNQYDYAIPGLVNLSWIEHAYAIDVNSTTFPKRVTRLEVRRKLEVTSMTLGYPCKICWLPNSQLEYGKWGRTQTADPNGFLNPTAGATYINPVGAVQTPNNPVTQIQDSNGNLWALTTYGTCGSVEPTWPATPVYPSYADATVVATTVTDGTCVWTAINPGGQGFRFDPIPSGSSPVWEIRVIAQLKPTMFTKLSQTLDPLPDDFVTWFQQGFWTQCTRRHPDAKVRAKFGGDWTLWLKDLSNAVKSESREDDDCGFYPETSIMDYTYSYGPVGPNYPWQR